MMQYQKNINGIHDLTQQGIDEISKYKNNYTNETKQITSNNRDWSTKTMMSLWIGMMVSIAVYMIASGLIVSGLSWKEALFTIVLGHTLVMIPAVAIGHFGTKYGLSFSMMSKFIFGSKGVYIPTFIRAFLGCFWFGIQSWIGGQAINAIIGTLYSKWYSLGFTGLFISFVIFWAINIYVTAYGSKAIKVLEEYTAPILILLSFCVIIWSLKVANWSLNTLLSQEILQGNETNFWILFFPALSSMIAFDGGIALSMPDFTRHSKTQKSQIIGQLAGAPIMTAFIAFVGICGTSGAYIAFGEAIWEPAILVSKFDNPLVVILFSIFIVLATITTNVVANLVPPSVVFSTLFKKITYKKAVIISGVIALLTQPWEALSDANSLIFSVCAILGALLGPISGLYIVAYWFEHKTQVDLVEIYKEDEGKYNYTNGWNKEIIVIFILSTIFIISGKFIPSMKFIFDNSYVIGLFATGTIYYTYLRYFNKKRLISR